MILIDANLLIYAVNRDARLHRPAKDWLQQALAGPETAGFSWNVLLAFVRITTRSGLFAHPLPVNSALDIIDSWVGRPTVAILEPTTRHFRILRDLLSPIGAAGNLTSDAHLAALAIEHGAVLCSADHDFARYPRLKWRNPLT